MKIFFISPKFIKKLKGKHIFTALIISVFCVLLLFQLTTRLEKSSLPAMSENVVQGNSSVILIAKGNVPKDGAMIFLNGEEYSPLLQGENVVEINRPSAVEVFCDNDYGFFVTVKATQGTTFIMPSSSIECNRGMNYIARCFFNQ